MRKAAIFTLILSLLVGGILLGEDVFKAQLSRLLKAYAYIKTFSYEKPKKKELLFAAVEGMTRGLDPHSRFLDPLTLRTLREDQGGKFYGLGISITSINGKITVVQVLRGTPAEKAGLLVGDAIIEADGKSLIGYTPQEAVKVLRGPKGTTVKILVEREGYSKPIEFTIKRAEIPLNTVRASFIFSGDVGYITLTSFGIKSPEELVKALKKFKSQGMKYLILDLRGNGGGALRAAVEISDLFLKKPHVIVSIRGRGQTKLRTFRAERDGQFEDLPMAVLVNRYSASASEILAGALQDNGRALIVGSKTFGKGLVQTLLGLPFNSAMALTTAKYYTPSGRCIQKPFGNWILYFWGINSPDYDKMPGGIIPDLKVKPELLKELAARMRGKGLFFRWASLFAKGKRPSSPRNLSRIKGETPYTLKITRSMLEDFLNYCRKNGLTWSEKEFREARRDIIFELKYELATVLWGPEAGTRVLLQVDRVFQRALQARKTAEKMALNYLSR